jgi:hypothetical protein
MGAILRPEAVADQRPIRGYNPTSMPPSPPSRGSARRVLLAAAATLAIAAVMAVLGSGLAPLDARSRYATAIVAVELARTPAEVLAAIGPPGSGDAREVLARVMKVDFAFLVAYPLLSLAIVAFLTRARAARVAGAALSLAMLVGDALENVAMFGLLDEITAQRVAGVMLWTTVKWAALFASALLVDALLAGRGGVARALALVPLATAVAGAVGLALPAHRPLVEIAGVFGVGATWLCVAGLAAVTLAARRR